MNGETRWRESIRSGKLNGSFVKELNASFVKADGQITVDSRSNGFIGTLFRAFFVLALIRKLDKIAQWKGILLTL